MKFLYIAAEHVSGTLSLLQAEHRRRGDECRFVTFFPSRWNFPDDICLNLPWMPDRSWVVTLRKSLARDYSARNESLPRPPYWQPNPFARSLFRLRDALNWPQINRVINHYGLDRADILTLDGGLDFTRDCRFAKSVNEKGAKIAAFYHGTDLRNRGIIREADELIELRLTSEWDLIELDARLRYLYLAVNTEQLQPRAYVFHKPVRIAHAARNPYKGTAALQAAVANLKQRHPVELQVYRDIAHDDLLRELRECDLVVDQLTNCGGWGYGMLSVEACSLGLPVITNIPPQMKALIGEHPFIQADSESVERKLEELITQEPLAKEYGQQGLSWVRDRHDIRAVGERLYQYYDELGWLNTRPT